MPTDDEKLINELTEVHATVIGSREGIFVHFSERDEAASSRTRDYRPQTHPPRRWHAAQNKSRKAKVKCELNKKWDRVQRDGVREMKKVWEGVEGGKIAAPKKAKPECR